VLELVDIAKSFGELRALRGVTVRLTPGRCHGVLGENGAGKSTLMNVAYGMLRPDGGAIRRNDLVTTFRSPRDAIAAGVGMVHQHFMLAGAMTVLDNVLLGDRRVRRWRVNRREAARRLAEMAEALGLPIDPAARVESLSVGRQQRVEILKALWRDARVLILDEPTAVLTPIEAEQLFAAVDRLKAQGRAVGFVSHKLAEVRRICDDVTVLRRGEVVWRGSAAEATAEELAEKMVGRRVPALVGRSSTIREATCDSQAGAGRTRVPARPVDSAQSASSNAHAACPAGYPAEPRLTLERVSADALQDVAMTLRAGEILGVAGVDGNGQQELAEVVVGLRRPTAGRVLFGDVDVSGWPLRRRLTLGLAHVPNDRKLEALATSMTVAENLALKTYDRRPTSRWGVVSWRGARLAAAGLMRRFDVRAASTQAPVGTLSGGNQQKVVLARELGTGDARVIVAMNPVRGLDVAAANFVYEQLLARRNAGAAVLLISSELDELLNVADRVGVLFNGRLTVTDFPRTTREQIGRLMAGLPAAAGEVRG
jgi:simple sugar transport system ATP-binding protein